AYEITQLLPQLLLVAVRRARFELGQRSDHGAGHRQLLVAQVLHFTQLPRPDHRSRGELERFEALKGARQRVAAHDDAMVLKHDTVMPLGEAGGDVVAELAAAWQRVGRKTDFAANMMCLVKQPCVRRLPADAERDQSDWMRVHDPT